MQTCKRGEGEGRRRRGRKGIWTKQNKKEEEEPIPLRDLQARMQMQKSRMEPKTRAAPQDKNKFIVFPSSSPKSTSLLIALRAYRQVREIRVEAVVLLGVAALMRLSAFRRTCRPCTWVCRSCELLVNSLGFH